MYSCSNTLFVQDPNIVTIVSLQCLSIVSYYLLKCGLVIFEENMIVRESFYKK